MNEGAALRVLSFLNDTNERHLASVANEKRKVTVIGEENEPEEIQEVKPSPAVINAEEPQLTPQQIKQFFKATEEGSVERLDELFDAITNVDPNMTHYTESLLMAAIRAKRSKVAEYLIDQLAIDVNYSTDLLEFRTRTPIPIRERTLTCRDLAYETGMMDLVDLIDITSDEVKPSIKRYLQRRLKVRLEDIHQSYIKRMKERNNRLLFQTQERERKLFEEDEEEKENEQSSNANIIDEIGPLPPPQPTIPPVSHRSYKSHIDETIHNIASATDSSIDETGKKIFRYSGYTLRFRLVETGSPKQQRKEQSRPKTTQLAFPIIPSSTLSTPRPLPSLLSRPKTTTTNNNNRYSISETNSQIPVRETRTSICRSARRISTPRITQTMNSESKPEMKSIPTIKINSPQRLLPKRIHQFNKNYGYIPQFQNTVYNEPHHSMPITLKATAMGLPSDTRLVRD